MELKKIEGIVVNEVPYKESSKILTIFTRELGLIGVISRGCKKQKSKLREVSQKLILADFYINYKKDGLSSLNSADLKNYFRNILYDPKDLLKKSYAFYILDLSLQVMKQEQNKKEEIYDLLLSVLEKMNEGFCPNILSLIIELKYFDFLGVKPSMDGCSICGKKDNIVTFHSMCNGFICRECYQNEPPIKEESLKMIRMLYYVDITRIKKLEIDSKVLEEITNRIEEYYLDHTGLYLSTKQNIKNVKKLLGIIN